MIREMSCIVGVLVFLLSITACMQSEASKTVNVSADEVAEELKLESSLKSVGTGVCPSSPDYKLIDSVYGIDLYKHRSKNIFIQRINTDKVNIGFLSDQDSATMNFRKHSLDAYWSGIKSNHPNLFSVVNLSFFAFNKEILTELTFGYKENGKIKTYGYGEPEQMDYRKMLIIDSNGKATIKTFSDSQLSSSINHQVAVGLDVDFDKHKYFSIGRNFIGITSDPTNDNVLVIAIGEASQNQMKNILKDFDCEEEDMIMFDGSGSSQLRTNKAIFYGDKRLIPNVMGVVPKK